MGYTRPAAGAETQVFDVARLDRTDALPLADALELAANPSARLLLNTRSGHATVLMSAASLTLDDGEIERRVRLMRPTERRNLAEVAALPELVESRFHIVTGLLLPILAQAPAGRLPRLPARRCRMHHRHRAERDGVTRGSEADGGVEVPYITAPGQPNLIAIEQLLELHKAAGTLPRRRQCKDLASKIA